MERQGPYWERSRRLRVGLLRRDVPPPTEGLIDGHEGRGGQGFAVREKILRCQQSPFSVEDGQKVCHAELIPLAGQVLRLLTRLRRGVKQVTACLLTGEIDQGVFCLLEGEQDALFVLARAPPRCAHRRP